MKRFRLILAMLALVLAFSLAFAACGNGTTNGDSGREGILTLTDIPAEYNGRYVYFQAAKEGGNTWYENVFWGVQPDDNFGYMFTLTQISDGKAEIPSHGAKPIGNVIGIEPYKGSDSFYAAWAIIQEEPLRNINHGLGLMSEKQIMRSLSPGKFSNGSAKLSWNFGEEWSSNISSELIGSWFYNGQELFSVTADGTGSIKGQGNYSVQQRFNPEKLVRFMDGNDVIGEFTYAFNGDAMWIEYGTGPFASWANIGPEWAPFVITKQ